MCQDVSLIKGKRIQTYLNLNDNLVTREHIKSIQVRESSIRMINVLSSNYIVHMHA